MENDLENLKYWLHKYEVQTSTYVPQDKIDHPVLRATKVIDNIVVAIKTGDLNAIELGCELGIENTHIPFGRALKSNIFNALRAQERFISRAYREKLVNLATSYLNAAYPPRESKMLCKLIKTFGEEYSNYVIKNVKSSTAEAKRWVNYLGN